MGLPRSGVKPMFPALTGRFFTTEPPEKSTLLIFKEFFFDFHYCLPLIYSSVASDLLLIPSSMLFISVIVFFSSSHCVHPLFSWVHRTSLWSLDWILYHVDCISPLNLVLLRRFCLVFFFFFLSLATYSSVSSFCLILCAYLCVLDWSLLSLGEVTLCRRHPMGPSKTFPSDH